MLKGNRSTYFLQADEIDHLTIRYTDFGEPLNIKRGIEMLHYYYSFYEEVAKELDGTDISYSALNSMTEKEIYALLVRVREVLLSLAFDR